jgi:signal transduction histidine kinase
MTEDPTVGPARPPIDQPAGSEPARTGARLDGMTTTDTVVLPPTDTSLDVPPRAAWLRQLGVDTAYTLVAFPVAIAAFVVVVTGLATGAGLLVVWVGLAVLALTLVAARGFAAAERAWLPSILGRPVPRPVYLRPEGGRVRQLLTPLRDPQTWLDALHAVVRFPLAVFSFVVTVTFWSAALGGLSYGLWQWALPEDTPDNKDLLELMGFDPTTGEVIAFYALIGVVFAALLPFAVRGAALLQATVGQILLTSRAATQVELERLTVGRDAAVAAEAVALRRLERDIHDGPQQRLVRLSMDLSRAQRQLDRDPEAARATLGEAAGQARETLEELRALSRGIAPPVLADRGLAAALAAVAARSPVPVDLAVELPTERLAPVTENSAYFVVSESLANVAKYSGATACRVDVRCDGDRLRVVVEDDGSGGAVVVPGHGLAGLADRLHAVDGELAVDSPPGGPTRVTADLPCA